MSLETLPDELFSQLCSHLNSSDLCTLALSCHTLQKPSERILYRNIRVSRPRSLIQLSRALSSIKLEGVKASYVRSLCIDFAPSSLKPFDFAPRHLARFVRTTLASVPSVLDLELIIPFYQHIESENSPFDFFSPDRFPISNLRSLSTNAPFDAALEAFFSSPKCAKLETLRLIPAHTRSTPRLPLATLPCLSKLAVPDFLVALLCCYRPITKLSIGPGRTYDGMLKTVVLGAGLAQGSAERLAELDVEIVPSVRNISTVASALPGVKSLTIQLPAYVRRRPYPASSLLIASQRKLWNLYLQMKSQQHWRGLRGCVR
ncbi:hypothetical protein BKA62DRAFT_690705 [Auriculariales sp. MPI-PUGE-AT-0066]|nr:hypothetical protein BKA62DRAFT_690705 [Auriculariales sp. MPI-PUGE-AT-0066]